MKTKRDMKMTETKNIVNRKLRKHGSNKTTLKMANIVFVFCFELCRH